MCANKNSLLHQAQRNKKDEFYTALEDIENELQHYRTFFKGKTVLCNCDDPYESNFFKYFAMHFNSLGLKKLIATCYNGSPVQGEQLLLNDILDLAYDQQKPDNQQAYKVIITEVKDENNDGKIDLSDVEYLIKNKKNVLTLLEGNGDFRSDECIELLKEADIVVTNPPFSLFRDYIAQLIEYNKKFLIIGNINCVTYKETFPLIKNNQMWIGASIHSGDREFRVPNDYPLQASACCERDGKKYIRVKGVRWFTNLDYKELHHELPLYKHYNPEEYPKYDNYDAIEVNETRLIPDDYDEMMGVPITFLDKYCPDQFEIVGMAKRGAGDPALRSKVYTKEQYSNYSDLNAGPTLFDENGRLYNTYPRILIRKKKDN